MPTFRSSRRIRPRGFTLIELLIVVAIVATLAGIAVPTFSDYLRRGRLIEAVARLADHRVRMEQFFGDNRRYDDGAGNCGYVAPASGAADAFAVECTASPTAYTVSATGIAGKGTAGFVYTIDEANARRTLAAPDGWIANRNCWVLRRDGTCA
jgi:type IV pilus assembly protein PilE